MFIPSFLLGLGAVLLGLLLTLVFPIQRGRLRNGLWDVITFVLFVAGFYFINYFDTLSNIVLGAVVGFVAVVIRDFRLWALRFRDQTYRRSHRYYWYGRMWGGRRRRRW
jgi:chromate transport protein ChrA